MKRKILSVFSIIFALICTLAVFAACTGTPEQPKPEPGPETGEYYCTASDGTDYLLNLFDGDQFTLTMASEELAGSYKADGEVLTLNPEGNVGAIAATYHNDVVTLTYNEVSYRFLRSILYTVSFDTDGADAIASVKVLNGKTVARPDAPSKGDLIFVGWYSDGAFRNEYNFNAPVTADLTLYARFVETLDPEFTVSFNTNGGGEAPASQKTVGHKLFDLPTPEWTGHTFVGWWVSQYDSANKLSYQYDEQEILEHTTLYAVWESNAPDVSVLESGISWTAYSGNNSYQVKITAPDGAVEERTVGTNSYAYDFASKAAGDYIVEVTVNGKTGTAYYKNKGIARVSVFEVENSTLLFNSVPNAEHYYITVVCGSSDHSHNEIDLGTETSFNFEDCEMRDGGITFVVKATAEGYVSSESATFSFQRTLDAVSGYAVDPATEVVSWDKVAHATSYYLTVTVNGTQVYSGSVGSQLSYSLKYANSGEVVVEVTPIARGWSSPAASVYTYQKARFATPTGFMLTGSAVVWNEVEGATGYEVTFDGKIYTVPSNSFDLVDMNVDASGSSHTLTVRALGTKDAQASLPSDPFIITNGEMGEVKYNAGVVSWDAVFGIETFAVKVNDGEEQLVSDVTSLAITLTQEGENTISVCAIDSEGKRSEWVSVSVTAWVISFDSQNGVSVDDIYRAAGDPLNLPETTRYGYTFTSWNDAPTGGSAYTDPYFEEGRNITLYAIWTANVYTVSFEAGSYSDETFASIEVTFGAPFKFDAPVSNDILYAFRGWFSGLNATGEQYTDYTGASRTEYLYAGDITLYAAWTPIFNFEDVGNGYAISKGPGINYAKEITVPVMYRNRLVTNVDDFSATNIEKINIPNTIRTITLNTDAYAFRNCTYLTYINIYDSGIPVDQVYFDVDGVLFYYNEAADMGRMEIRYYPYARSASEYTIPSTIKGAGDTIYYVNTIPSGAFYAASSGSASLAKVNIPATISLLEEKAFFNYNKLVSVNFLSAADGEAEANSLDMRKDAIYQANITHIRLPKRFSAENPRDVFGNWTYLGYIDVEDGGVYSSVDGLLTRSNPTYDTELAFYPMNRQLGEDGKAVIPEGISTANRAREFVIPDEIYAIGKEAVLDNSILHRVVIPGHVRYIGVSAFQGLRYVQEIEFLGEKEDLDLIIDEKAFLGENWTNPTSPTIPNYTTSLKSLTLPANLAKLGKYAFGALSGASNNENNSALREVTLNVERDSVDYAAGAFSGTLSGNVHSTSYINTLYFGAGVPTFDILDVFGPNVRAVYVDEDNPNYWSDPDTGVLYSGDKSTLILFPGDWEGPYALPEGITNIQSGMFKERTGLTEIIIHNGVTRVGESAFQGCTALEKVTFLPDGEEGLIIEDNAFYGCTALANVELPERTTSIGTWAFRDCTQLTSFVIPKNVEYLGTSDTNQGELAVFFGCKALKELSVAEGNTHFVVEGGVLYSLREVKLSADATDTTFVPDKTIYVPAAVEGEITVSGYIRSVGALSFTRSSGDKPKITKIYFEDVKETYDPETGELESSEIDFNQHKGSSAASPFNSLSTLQEIRFPAGMKVMASGLIASCGSLTKINVPNTVTSIQPNAFIGGSKLSTIIFDEGGTVGLRIEDGVQSGGGTSGSPSYSSVFGATGVTEFEFPARLTYLGQYAFAYNPGGTSSAIWSSKVTSVKFAEESTFALTIGEKAFYYTKSLKNVELPGSLAKLPTYAFAYSSISSITLPEGLAEIGNYAFQSCSSLTEIEFPASLKTIGTSAFSGTKLTSLNLVEGLETIGDSAFSGLTTLAGELKIPASVTKIGNSAFNNTRFSKIVTAVDNKLETIGNSAFGSNTALNEFVFGETSTPLTFGNSVFTGCTALTSFEFPTNVKVIGDSIFAGLTKLKSVTFAKGTSQLESIGQLAFSKTGLTEISFPESSNVTGIALGANLFKSCTELTTLNISASITKIDGVLNGCASIKTIKIDSNNQSLEADDTLPIIYEKKNGVRGAIMLVYGELTGRFEIAGGTSIGGAAFANQAKLEVVFIPASVRTIGDYAFQNCVNLKQVIIEEGSVLESIGSGAFMNCYRLESINLQDALHLSTFGDGKASYTPAADHNGVFMNAGIHSENPLKIKFPASVTKVGSYMFANSGAVEIDMSATKLTQLPTGTGTTSYGYRAVGLFSGSIKLTSVTLPSSITFLGSGTFAGCTALTTLDLSNLTNLKWVGNTSATTAPSTSAYSSYLFIGCTNLETITFPTSVTHIGGRMFVGCDSITSIKGLDNVQLYANYFYEGSGFTSITVSKVLGNYMFYSVPNLQSVTIQDVSTVSATNLFDKSTSITSVTLTGVSSITGTYMFRDCTSLETVDMSDTTFPTLPNYTFQNCTSLSSVALPDTLKSIGTYAFQNCTSLNNVILPDTLEKIDNFAFQGCTSLSNMTLSAGLTSIGTNAFENSGLSGKLTLPQGLTTIGTNAFHNTLISSVNIPQSVTGIGAGVFADCPNLTSVDFEEGAGGDLKVNSALPTSTTATALSPFENSPIGEIALPSRLKYIPNYMFRNAGVTKITSWGGVANIGNYAFWGSSLEEIVLPANVVFFQQTYNGNRTANASTYVFANNLNLKSVSFADGFSTTALTNYMFDGCASLETVDFTNAASLVHLGQYTFRGTVIKSVDLSPLTNLKYIGATANAEPAANASAYVFYGVTTIKSVKLPENLTHIGGWAFYKSEIEEIEGLEHLVLIGNYAFNGSKFDLAGVKFDALETLGEYAFYANENITAVDFSDTALEAIPANAFRSNTSLVSIVLPETVTSIGDSAFNGASSLSQDGIDLSNITSIGNFAFFGTAFTQLTLPAKLKSLGASAFVNCDIQGVNADASQLTIVNGLLIDDTNTVVMVLDSAVDENGDITVPANVKLKGYIFNGVGAKRLVIEDGITEIPGYTFFWGHFDEVVLPETLTTIASYAFDNARVGYVEIPRSVTSVGNYAFANFVGRDVEVDGEYVFRAEIVFLGDGSALNSVTYLFQNSTLTNIVLPEGLTTLGAYSFQGSTVASVTLPASMTGLSATPSTSNAPFINSTVESATVLGAVLPNYFFYNAALQSVTLTNPALTSIGNYAFANTALVSVVLPAGLTTIGTYVFQGSTLESIEIPASVTSIGTGAFSKTYALKTVVFLEPAEGEEAAELTFAAGATSATASTVGVFRESAIEEITLPGRMTTLAAGMFHYAAVKTVVISEGTTEIGAAAFAYATSLESVVMPASVTKIGNYAYAYTNVESLMLGEGVTELGTHVYSHVETIGDLKPEDFMNLQVIGNNVFEYTTNVKNVEFSDKITSTGNYLFQYSNIEFVKFPGSVVTIGNFMFDHCEKVESVVIEDLTVEGATRGTMSGTFRNSSIKSVVLGKGATSLSSTFYNCPNITSVKVPEGVTTVTSQAFQDCTSLTEVILPETLTDIGTQAFAYCTNLKSLVIPESIASIAVGSTNNLEGGTHPFAGWTSEQTIYFRASESYVGSLVGFAWVNTTFYRLQAKLVFDYNPEA